jgi:Holliday junction DNA helicase RuvA
VVVDVAGSVTWFRPPCAPSSVWPGASRRRCGSTPGSGRRHRALRIPGALELETFQRLIGVAGVGPRIALAVLSALSPAELAEAVHSGDAERLRKTPGVGTKTAQRIVLELRGRLDAQLAATAGDHRSDAVSALVNLGYSQRDAGRAVDAVLADHPAADISDVLRLALQRLTR